MALAQHDDLEIPVLKKVATILARDHMLGGTDLDALHALIKHLENASAPAHHAHHAASSEGTPADGAASSAAAAGGGDSAASAEGGGILATLAAEVGAALLSDDAPAAIVDPYVRALEEE